MVTVRSESDSESSVSGPGSAGTDFKLESVSRGLPVLHCSHRRDIGTVTHAPGRPGPRARDPGRLSVSSESSKLALGDTVGDQAGPQRIAGG